MAEKLQLRGESQWGILGDIRSCPWDYRREPDKHVYLHVSYGFPLQNSNLCLQVVLYNNKEYHPTVN